MRHFHALDSFMIAGRGRVFTGFEPNPILEQGEVVMIVGEIQEAGRVGRVIGLEHHKPAGGRKPNDKVGVLLGVINDASNIRYCETEEGPQPGIYVRDCIEMPVNALLELLGAAIVEGCGDRVGAAIAHIEFLARQQGYDLKQTWHAYRWND